MEDVTNTYVGGHSISDLKLKGFKVYPFDCNPTSTRPNYRRRDFYKICMIKGTSLIHYADISILMDGTYLFFSNPRVPYSIERLHTEESGHVCLFTEDFLNDGRRSESLQESPLFKLGIKPVFSLNEAQELSINNIFEKMLAEQETDYLYKNEVIRNYIDLIIHEALRMHPEENVIRHQNASSRITSLFLELLERQFPIESPEQPLKLKTAQGYADQLSVHVNHLNRSVKEVTGKPTTAHISERIISEAKALLQHTDWNISEIAYGLGFEYPTYFNNYFKRMTGAIPKSLRV
jgi:AraC-like DNA-binding protein